MGHTAAFTSSTRSAKLLLVGLGQHSAPSRQNYAEQRPLDLHSTTSWQEPQPLNLLHLTFQDYKLWYTVTYWLLHAAKRIWAFTVRHALELSSRGPHPVFDSSNSPATVSKAWPDHPLLSSDTLEMNDERPYPTSSPGAWLSKWDTSFLFLKAEFGGFTAATITACNCVPPFGYLGVRTSVFSSASVAKLVPCIHLEHLVFVFVFGPLWTEWFTSVRHSLWHRITTILFTPCKSTPFTSWIFASLIEAYDSEEWQGVDETCLVPWSWILVTIID